MVKDEQLAQDIVQEAFIRLQTRLAGITQPKAWLYTTVRRLAIDHLRKTRKVIPFQANEGSPELDPTDPAPTPDSQAESHEHTGLMRICVERLPQKERMIVHLKFIDDLSYKQIAKQMGMTVGHVGYALHHALKSLELELHKEGITR